MIIVCNANREGLCAVMQQKTGWRAVCFASRVLTTFEQKYSLNELELLVVVWVVEKFRNYVCGTEFEVLDHKALTTILKGNRAYKTFSSRLTRWVDTLLPLQLIVTHEPGRALGMADCLSRHPEPSNVKNQIKAEDLWNNWFTVSEHRESKRFLEGRCSKVWHPAGNNYRPRDYFQKYSI